MTKHADKLTGDRDKDKKFVLLVDDSPALLEMLALRMQMEKGWEVINLFNTIDLPDNMRDHPEVEVLAWLEKRAREGEPLPDIIITDKAMHNNGDAARMLIEGAMRSEDARIKKLRFIVATGDERAPRQYHGHPCQLKPLFTDHIIDEVERLTASGRRA